MYNRERGGITMTTPGANYRLEYPRQANGLTSYFDINNFEYVNSYFINDVALHNIIDIITNQCREFSERLTYYYEYI